MKLNECSTKELIKELGNRKIKRNEIVIDKVDSCPIKYPAYDFSNFIKISGNENVDVYFGGVEGTFPIEELKDIYKAISDIQLFNCEYDKVASACWYAGGVYFVQIDIHHFNADLLEGFMDTKTFRELRMKLYDFYKNKN